MSRRESLAERHSGYSYSRPYQRVIRRLKVPTEGVTNMTNEQEQTTRCKMIEDALGTTYKQIWAQARRNMVIGPAIKAYTEKCLRA